MVPGTRSRVTRIGLAGWLLGSLALLAPVATTAADAITLSTPYPAVGAAPGAKVSFAISVKVFPASDRSAA